MTSYQRKAVYRDRENIFEFSRLHGIGQGKTFFFTLTFKDNVTDRREAGERWNVMRTGIQQRYHDFRYILVAERQKRGAWHFHILCFIPGLPSLKRFITFINVFSSKSKKKFGFSKCTWTKGKDYKGVACYMTKYLQKEEKRENGVRYVSYSRNWSRVCSCHFGWLAGASANFRHACRELALNFPRTFKLFYRHAGYYRLLSVVNSWLLGEYDSAVGAYLEFKHPLFRAMIKNDIYDLRCYFFEKKSFLLTKEDISDYDVIRHRNYDAVFALKEFFSMKEHEIEFHPEDFAV